MACSPKYLLAMDPDTVSRKRETVYWGIRARKCGIATARIATRFHAFVAMDSTPRRTGCLQASTLCGECALAPFRICTKRQAKRAVPVDGPLFESQHDSAMNVLASLASWYATHSARAQRRSTVSNPARGCDGVSGQASITDTSRDLRHKSTA
jgi:hypothetical protein